MIETYGGDYAKRVRGCSGWCNGRLWALPRAAAPASSPGWGTAAGVGPAPPP